MQKIPRLELHVSDEQLVVSHHRLADREALEVPIQLSDLMINGTDEAAKKLGMLILQILTLWHKETFSKLAIHPVSQTQVPDLDLVDALVQRSLSLKTRAYIQTIEDILAHPTEGFEQACASYAASAWPELRAELERFDSI